MSNETVAGGHYLNEAGELVDAFGRPFVGPQDIHALRRVAKGGSPGVALDPAVPREPRAWGREQLVNAFHIDER